MLLAADKGDDVVHDLGHGFKRLARAGDRLVGRDGGALDAEFHQGVQEGDIGLQRAVALDGDEAALCPQPPALRGDNGEMVVIDLGNDHGHVGRRTVRRIVGDDGHFELCILFLERLDLLLFHVDGAKDKVHEGRELLCIRFRVQKHHVLCIGGHGDAHCPAVADGLAVRLSRRARARRERHGLKEGMPVKQGDKSLSDHAGRADHADLILFLHRSLLKNAYLQKKKA